MSGSYRDIYLGELANICNQISPTRAQDNLWGNVVTGGESGYNLGSPHGNIYPQMPNNCTGKPQPLDFSLGIAPATLPNDQVVFLNNGNLSQVIHIINFNNKSYILDCIAVPPDLLDQFYALASGVDGGALDAEVNRAAVYHRQASSQTLGLTRGLYLSTSVQQGQEV